MFKSKSLVTISSSLWRFLPKKWYQIWPYLSHMLVSHMPKWNTLAQCPLGILSCISRWCHITPCELMQNVSLALRTPEERCSCEHQFSCQMDAYLWIHVLLEMAKVWLVLCWHAFRHHLPECPRKVMKKHRPVSEKWEGRATSGLRSRTRTASDLSQSGHSFL